MAAAHRAGGCAGEGFKMLPKRKDRGVRLLPGVCSTGARTLVSLALALALATGCGGNAATATVEPAGEVRGLVEEVVGRNIVEIDLLRIRDESGRIWSFGAGEGFIGFSPSHLRAHQLLGETVQVTYETRGGMLVAVALSD